MATFGSDYKEGGEGFAHELWLEEKIKQLSKQKDALIALVKSGETSFTPFCQLCKKGPDWRDCNENCNGDCFEFNDEAVK